MSQKIAFKTIGCKVNQYETGAIVQSFVENGYDIDETGNNSDIFVINTCAVTKEAARKSKQMIRKAIRLNPAATVIVTGCAVQSDLEEIEKCKDISLIVGNYFKENIFKIVEQSKSVKNKPVIFVNSAEYIDSYSDANYFSSSTLNRKLIKIQDGCNQFCSYCIIPYLRGRARSRSTNQILNEICHLAEKGTKEIVLLGINLGSYGTDFDNGKTNLAQLIKKIDNISGIERIRLSSIELPYIKKELIETFLSCSKLCHHLHIPLQSGDRRILSLMNRTYSPEQFKETITFTKKMIPDIAITTDIIVGFPGEDEPAFQNTLNMIKEVGFSRLHVFPYSERTSTLASYLPGKTEEAELKKRSNQLLKISAQLTRDYINKNIGCEKDVLIEYLGKHEGENFAYGLTDNYIKVFIYKDKMTKGQLKRVKIIETMGSYAIGNPV